MNETKKTGLWKVLTAIVSCLLIIFMIGTTVANAYRGVIDIYFDLSPYEIRVSENTDVTQTEYYKSDYVLENATWNGLSSKNGEEAYYDDASLKLADYAAGEEVEAEGTVLLFNNGALPLSKNGKVSTFGVASMQLVCGGTGSGSVDSSSAAKLDEALNESGLEVNKDLADFYKKMQRKGHKREAMAFFQKGSYAINEIPWSEFSEELTGTFAAYGDAAIVVLGREGGEDNDLPRTNTDFQSNKNSGDFTDDSGNDGTNGNYLALSAEELELLQQLTALKQNGTFQSIILLLNSNNPIQLDFLNNDLIDIDAALWIGGVGFTGINAVADILVGDINPSGSLPDTFYVNNLDTPAMVNFGKTKFANADADLDKIGADTYTIYEEGIYVGYKYTESRYFDKIMDQNNAGDYEYSKLVAFPFGYGSSYTTFAYSDMTMEETDTTFEFSVTVTNTGDVAGKEVVQIYMSAPYTEYDKEQNIEKSAVELVGFAKTQILNEGDSETLTISVEKENMKAYDSLGTKTYIVDAGDYYFVAARDAHSATNNLLSYLGCTIKNGMDSVGDSNLVSVYTQEEFDAVTYATTEDGTDITNQFDNADLRIYEDGAQADSFRLLSRQDWTGTYPVAKDHANGELTFTDQMKAEVSRPDSTTLVETEGADMPIFDADGDLTLAALIDVDYDDPLWDELLNQLTYEEMSELCSQAFHQTAAIESIAKPGTLDENGPVGFTRSFMGSSEKCMSYPSCPVMAATMNVELIHKMGQQIGLDGLHGNFQGLYGPGVNIHRTPYCGRNFEYFSEDSILSGWIVESEIQGIQSKGVYVYAKHFALNDQETMRHGICTFASEQTIRENYLKAFEYALSADKGNGHAAMTGFNRIGVVWSGAHKGLLTNVLRNEWQFDGFTISDAWTDIADTANSGNRYGNAAAAILAGGDTLDGTALTAYESDELKNSATFCNALRESSKRILYVVANSSGMNGLGAEDQVVTLTSWWQSALYGVDAVLTILLILCIIQLKRNKNIK